jgi:hypothetical protein
MITIIFLNELIKKNTQKKMLCKTFLYFIIIVNWHHHQFWNFINELVKIIVIKEQARKFEKGSEKTNFYLTKTYFDDPFIKIFTGMGRIFKI